MDLPYIFPYSVSAAMYWTTKQNEIEQCLNHGRFAM